MNASDQAAKAGFIASYFDEVEARLRFLRELAESGHTHEALTLCLVYIDRLAQVLCWPGHSSAHNFVSALMEYGGNPLMAFAHPLQAKRAFEELKSLKTIAAKIDAVFPGPSYELLTMLEFEQAVAEHLTSAEIERLNPHLWRAAIANVAYQHLRNPAVHGFGTSDGLLLTKTSISGDQPIPILGFSVLHGCAFGLAKEARRRSEANGQWFGNDAIVHGTK
jgi:hypothetical protein